MKLVIAEKPSVARAIYPILNANEKHNGYMEGNNYIVSWCFGHLVGLQFPNAYCDEWAGKWSFSQLPMIPDTYKFKVTESCTEQFNLLKKLMNRVDVDEIICATDADREGECIFRYVYNLAGCKKSVKRLWVSSLEEEAVVAGLKNMKPAKEYNNLYSAGFSRAKADWLVGMNASRLFSVRFDTKLNIGRVQTPTLAMIVQRDFEVKNFIKQKFFTVDIDCGSFVASSDRIDDQAVAEMLTEKTMGKTAIVSDVKKENKTVNPPKLYDLTTLQRDANKKFGYTAQQTLDYQQMLYEKKLTTYPRTDSQYISDDMENVALSVIEVIGDIFNFGKNEYPDVKRVIDNSKVSGHHAIIPTMSIKEYDIASLPEGERNVLMLIAQRLMCATAKPHKYQTVKVTLKCENTDFYATARSVIDNGWKEIEEKIKTKQEEPEEKEQQSQIPDSIAAGQQFDNIKSSKSEHFTSPPKSYTEDTLLSAMEHAGQADYDDETEKKGLGTPATRAATIEGLVKNEYVQRKGKKLLATEKGISLIDVVPEEVKSPKLTADWEMKLQQIERGNFGSDSFISEIESFIRSICSKYGTVASESHFESNSVNQLGNCPKCGNEVKKGKYGFYCTGKCGMYLSKVYGKELTEAQLSKLLNGKEISYTVAGKKTIVMPEVVENEYNGKINFQWKTRKG